MDEIEKNVIERINRLHNSIMGMFRKSVPMAVEIGQLLCEQKKNLGHGKFTPWVLTHLCFDIRTAQRYMKIYNNREALKNDSVSLLTQAHKRLTLPNHSDPPNRFDSEIWKKSFEYTILTEPRDSFDFLLPPEHEFLKFSTSAFTDLEKGLFGIFIDPGVDDVHFYMTMSFMNKRNLQEPGYMVGDMFGFRCDNIERIIWQEELEKYIIPENIIAFNCFPSPGYGYNPRLYESEDEFWKTFNSKHIQHA